MAKYLILNTVFLLAIISILSLLKSLVWNKPVIVTLIHSLAATAIFDSLIIVSGIVGYDTGSLIGIKIGAAPVEDFFYAVAAALLIPGVWHLLDKDKTNEHH